ncbi:zinc finger protein 708-like [Schistocerca gregaria]|uniref:zinc finger protein 708-like n=1 Tax=Schistocerca gregaria TaxID=7010 RepID=UPI00211EB5BA|nr:zinc finger protein 708-like [Schistocerca gregaria]
MSENYHVLTAGNHEKYGYSDEDQSSILLDSLPEVSVPEHNVWSPYEETRKASKKSSKDVCNTSMGNDADKISDYGTLSAAVNVSAQGDLLTTKMWACYLKAHILIHTGKKPHKCEICGRCFALSSSLKTHVSLKTQKLIHTGKKPHKCVICGKSFRRSDSLKTHELVHTGKKPHKCEICGKSFARSGYLKTHLLNHTGKKPRKPVICDKSFAQSSNLKTHKLIHNGHKPHKCDICGGRFALSSYLKKQAAALRRRSALPPAAPTPEAAPASVTPVWGRSGAPALTLCLRVSAAARRAAAPAVQLLQQSWLH